MNCYTFIAELACSRVYLCPLDHTQNSDKKRTVSEFRLVTDHYLPASFSNIIGHNININT
jgi:hypothetical protein